MYTKDKSIRITLRLTESQYNFVKASSDVLGVSPSEFLRMVINSTMAVRLFKEVREDENRETDFNNIV